MVIQVLKRHFPQLDAKLVRVIDRLREWRFLCGLVNQVAQMLNVPAQKIYYATRVGLLKASRRGAAWVIHMDDIKGYQENYLSKQVEGSQAM